MSSFRTLTSPGPLAALGSLLVATPTLAGRDVFMTKDQIAQNIIGRTLNAKRMGMPVRIMHKTDGTVTMKFAIMSGSGTWSYNGRLLTSGPRKGQTCVTFEHLGGNKYRNSEGIHFTVRK